MGLVSPSAKVMKDERGEAGRWKRSEGIPMDFENNVEGQMYYLTAAMTLDIHPLILERKLINQEISYDTILQSVDLGLRVYNGALNEIESHGEIVINTKKEVFKDFLEKAIRDLNGLHEKMKNTHNLPKIQFQEGVSFIDTVLLIKALQKHWIEPHTKNIFWTNFFKFPTTSEDIPAYMARTLDKYDEPSELFTKHLLTPGMTSVSDFNDLEEMFNLRLARKKEQIEAEKIQKKEKRRKLIQKK